MSITLNMFLPQHTQEASVVHLETEDIEKAREIGVLTPRETHHTDYQGPSEKTVNEIDFLLMQHSIEEHESIMDDIEDLWNKDIYGSTTPPHGSSTQVVRIIIKKTNFYIGSIDGNGGNVYIHSQGTLNLFSFYLMDLIYDPRFNNYRCIKIHPRRDTSAMLQGSTTVLSLCRCIGNSLPLTRSYTYHVPMDINNIGIIIGKNGKNINSLASYVRPTWLCLDGINPDVTISPISKTLAKITVDIPYNCDWEKKSVEEMISYMHA
jgi:hypothetical protein